jgi:hypothetical protein
MKKILIALIFGLFFLPLNAAGQKWIEPYTKSDGSKVEGHWQTPEEARQARQESSSPPSRINPSTGEINPYYDRYGGSRPINPNPNAPPYYDGLRRYGP